MATLAEEVAPFCTLIPPPRRASSILVDRLRLRKNGEARKEGRQDGRDFCHNFAGPRVASSREGKGDVDR